MLPEDKCSWLHTWFLNVIADSKRSPVAGSDVRYGKKTRNPTNLARSRRLIRTLAKCFFSSWNEKLVKLLTIVIQKYHSYFKGSTQQLRHREYGLVKDDLIKFQKQDSNNGLPHVQLCHNTITEYVMQQLKIIIVSKSREPFILYKSKQVCDIQSFKFKTYIGFRW